MFKQFFFNTGVKPENVGYKIHKGHVEKGGTIQIPFECEDVPANAIFKYACDYPESNNNPKVIHREIKNSAMVSRFAFFLIP